MKRLIEGGLNKTAPEAKTKEQIGALIDVLLATKNVVSSAIKAMPQASLVWASVYVALEVSNPERLAFPPLTLQILDGPIKQIEACCNSIEYVSKQMEWYCYLSANLSEEPIHNN